MTDYPLSRRDTILTGATLPFLAATELHAQAQAAAPNPRPRTHDLLGKPAPTTSLNKVGGGLFQSKDLRGRTTIVQFWGLWCPDCLRDTDDVALLASRVARTRGLRFMSVHTRGRYGRWGNLDAFFAEKGYRYPVAIDDDQAAYRAWAVKWVPTFLIVNRQGVIVDYTTDLTAGDGIGVNGLLNKALAVARA